MKRHKIERTNLFSITVFISSFILSRKDMYFFKIIERLEQGDVRVRAIQFSAEQVDITNDP